MSKKRRQNVGSLEATNQNISTQASEFGSEIAAVPKKAGKRKK